MTTKSPGRASRAVTAEVLEEEARFLLKTLLRDDLFGDQVTLSEAEKLLEASLSLPFADYCAVLVRQGAVSVDRGRNLVSVMTRGRDIARGAADPDFFAGLVAAFAAKIESPRKTTSTTGQPAVTVATSVVTERVPERAVERERPPSIVMERERPPTILPDRQRERAEREGGWQKPPATVVLDGRYEKGTLVGEGSLGTVSLASDALLGRSLALKELGHVLTFVTYIPRPELVDRLKRAVLEQAKIEHPAVVTVVDLDFEADPPRILTALARGGSLRARMTRRKTGTLPVKDALRVFVQCALGLRAAHDEDVAHGALKPENVLFDARGNAMLSDFGLSRATDKGARTGPPAYVGAGNPSYMAPEQMHKSEYGPAADIYALGILAYEMLAGTLPGRRSPLPSQVNKDVPVAFDDIFDKMTKDRLEERYRHVDDLLDDLYAKLPRDLVGDKGVLMLTEEDALPSPDSPTEATLVSSKDAEPIPSGEGSTGF